MSSASSFHSAAQSPRSPSSPQPASPSRFTAAEEAELLSASHAQKTEANALFGTARYSEAIGAYDQALASCPVYLDYEVAVLKSNVAACHIKLEEWKEAVEAATAALDGLDRVLPSAFRRAKKQRTASPLDDPAKSDKKRPDRVRERQRDENGRSYDWSTGRRNTDSHSHSQSHAQSPSPSQTHAIPRAQQSQPRTKPPDSSTPSPSLATSETPLPSASPAVVELEGEDDAALARELAALKLDDARREQVDNLRAKALLRRARGNVEQGGWASLAAADEDYKELVAMPTLPVRDQRYVRAQLALLPPRIQAAQQKETAEMMGKLKDLGNGLLKPFGLSTDMFQFTKDENTGGYSMSFGG